MSSQQSNCPDLLEFVAAADDYQHQQAKPIDKKPSHPSMPLLLLQEENFLHCEPKLFGKVDWKLLRMCSLWGGEWRLCGGVGVWMEGGCLLWDDDDDNVLRKWCCRGSVGGFARLGVWPMDVCWNELSWVDFFHVFERPPSKSGLDDLLDMHRCWYLRSSAVR